MADAPSIETVYLTPAQVEELKRRYQAKNQSDAVLALLIAAAGFYVLQELVKAQDKPKRKHR